MTDAEFDEKIQNLSDEHQRGVSAEDDDHTWSFIAGADHARSLMQSEIDKLRADLAVACDVIEFLSAPRKVNIDRCTVARQALKKLGGEE